MTKRRGRGEGAVFFSKAKKVWVARAVAGVRPDGKPDRVEVTGRTKAEAMAKVRAASGRAPGGATTAGEAITRWLEGVARPTVEPTTYETYEGIVRVHLIPRLGPVPLKGLTPERVEAFFAELHADGVSGGLAKKISQVLKTALTSAVRRRLIAASPAEHVRAPRARDAEVQPFTPDEVRRAIGAATGDELPARLARHAALFVLAFATGARQGELLGLGWEHLDLGRATMRVERSLYFLGGAFHLKPPKSKRGRRVVGLPAFAVEALARHRARAESDGLLAAPVFHALAGGHLGRSMASRHWAALLRLAGVPRRKFHNTRHTHASQLLSMGVSLVEVARRIGDHPETVLRVYQHWMPTNRDVPGMLDGLYGRESGGKVEAAFSPE